MSCRASPRIGICHTSTVGAATSFLKHPLSIFSQKRSSANSDTRRFNTQAAISITMTYKQAEPTRTVHIHPLVRLPGLLLKCLTNTASQKKEREEEERFTPHL